MKKFLALAMISALAAVLTVGATSAYEADSSITVNAVDTFQASLQGDLSTSFTLNELSATPATYGFAADAYISVVDYSSADGFSVKVAWDTGESWVYSGDNSNAVDVVMGDTAGAKKTAVYRFESKASGGAYSVTEYNANACTLSTSDITVNALNVIGDQREIAQNITDCDAQFSIGLPNVELTPPTSGFFQGSYSINGTIYVTDTPA